jgi:hypothetical protein
VPAFQVLQVLSQHLNPSQTGAVREASAIRKMEDGAAAAIAIPKGASINPERQGAPTPSPRGCPDRSTGSSRPLRYAARGSRSAPGAGPSYGPIGATRYLR